MTFKQALKLFADLQPNFLGLDPQDAGSGWRGSRGHLFARASFGRFRSGALAYPPCGGSRCRKRFSTRGRLATPRVLTPRTVALFFVRTAGGAFNPKHNRPLTSLFHLAGTAVCRLQPIRQLPLPRALCFRFERVAGSPVWPGPPNRTPGQGNTAVDPGRLPSCLGTRELAPAVSVHATLC